MDGPARKRPTDTGGPPTGSQCHRALRIDGWGMRVECLTWIYTPERRVLFFATMSPDHLAGFRPAFHRIVQSTSLP